MQRNQTKIDSCPSRLCDSGQQHSSVRQGCSDWRSRRRIAHPVTLHYLLSPVLRLSAYMSNNICSGTDDYCFTPALAQFLKLSSPDSMAAKHQQTTLPPLQLRRRQKMRMSLLCFMPSITTEPNVGSSMLATTFDFLLADSSLTPRSGVSFAILFHGPSMPETVQVDKSF